MLDRVLMLAQSLLDDGYVDNEPDARLMAVRILVAAGAVASARHSDDARPEHPRADNRNLGYQAP